MKKHHAYKYCENLDKGAHSYEKFNETLLLLLTIFVAFCWDPKRIVEVDVGSVYSSSNFIMRQWAANWYTSDEYL